MAQRDDIDLIALWKAVVAYRWFLIGVVVLSGIVSVLIALLLPRIYQGEVVMAPVEMDTSQQLAASLPGALGSFLDLSSLGGGGATASHTSLAVLKSDAFTSEFVRRHGLMEPLFEDRFDDEDQPPTLGDALELIATDIRSITVDNRTGLISLKILWKDRFDAAQWANSMVADVNEQLRQQAITEAERSIVFLKAELEKTSYVELKSAIYRSIETQINAIMLANVKEEYAFKVIDPAMVADEDKFVKPRRKLIAVSGVLLGGFSALMIVLFLAVVKPASQRTPEQTG